MMEHPKWDKVFAFASWLIVLALIFSSYWAFTHVPGPNGPVAQIVSPIFASFFYGTLYAVQSFLLAYSKTFKKKNMRKKVLMFIYITGFFTTLLSVLLIGFQPRIIDNIIITVAAAGCWLYWKFKTEYLNQEEFYKATLAFRDDMPPSVKDS